MTPVTLFDIYQKNMRLDASTKAAFAYIKSLLLAFKIIFLVISLGLLLMSYGEYKKTSQLLANSGTAQGAVVSLKEKSSRQSTGRLYAPVVEFRDDMGEKIAFVDPFSSSPPSYSAGDGVEVIYDMKTPQNARINSFVDLWMTSTLSAFIGSIFLLFLVGTTAVEATVYKGLEEKKAQKEYLQVYGTPIKATLQSIDKNTSLKVNGRSPYQMLAQWQNPTTSEIHIFKSENIWFDPTDYIKTDHLTVLIEEENPPKYYVDIDFLPKMVD